MLTSNDKKEMHRMLPHKKAWDEEGKEVLWYNKDARIAHTRCHKLFSNKKSSEGIRTDLLPASLLDKNTILFLEWTWEGTILVQKLTPVCYYIPLLVLLKLFHLKFEEIKSEVEIKIRNSELWSLDCSTFLLRHSWTRNGFFFLFLFLERKQKILSRKREKKYFST